ncbi:helix-turn-helix domain protein [Leadbetterella byssophila DSM 17132]|uniref:Helix-turn-helix domain protein n=1 Tax=Leadbetterella byssophila (strain DSM 17132 / JCM 16389 / KACC 11308 / NBRC 106382 / 4M15) TaxID=649349 RepID=E4RV39_LEAB4|nr:helix-turn-helix transcriptional regulator [Leadbetterella byssophila]ADQ17919.1 helix-turn-helix domain protein [Leadbetterella byssophila DSM 17132]
MYGAKIRMIREMRGLSQENVADELDISQSTYSLYESDKIKITGEMIEKIASVLNVSPLDIMSHQPVIINFQSNKGTQQAIGNIETYTSTPKELYDEMLAAKNAEIERLQKIIEKLIEGNH